LQGSQNLSSGALSWQVKPLLADFDPAGGWPAEGASAIGLDSVPGFGARGAFVIAARKYLPQTDIQLGEIVGPNGDAVALETKLTRIVRTLERSYWKSPSNELEQVGRFLTPWVPRDLAAGEFSEIWLTVEVPADLLPGSYRGTIRLSSDAKQILAIPLELTVRRYSLDTGGPKSLGIYYYLEDKLFDEDQINRELADLRAHGIRYLLTDLELQHSPSDAGYRTNVNMARRGLELIHHAGFRDLVVIQNGLLRVTKWRARESNKPIEEDKVFARVVDRTMADLSKLAAEFPDLDIYQTHMDEVFANQDTLDTYIGIATHIRRTSQIPLYITLNTRAKNYDALRERLDPFVDFRGLHGYSIEWWMARGNHLAEMERELTAAGDRALFYHNARGPYFTAQRSRIVNGLLLWAWPVEAHAPWIYQRYAGNPFDDRDGNRHDFGMAFPGPGDQLVSTRLWEATLEGWFDLQHLQTLERLVKENGNTRPEVASRARSLLESTRNLIREATPAKLLDVSGASKNASGGLFIPKPVSQRSPKETPLLTALERQLGLWGLDDLRGELASLIEELSRPL
jgi:hypothetical protein